MVLTCFATRSGASGVRGVRLAALVGWRRKMTLQGSVSSNEVSGWTCFDLRYAENDGTKKRTGHGTMDSALHTGGRPEG